MEQPKELIQDQDVDTASCLNCEAELASDASYCSHCGQRNRPLLKTKHLLGDLVNDYLTVDNKIFRSIKPLFFSPGTLSVEYCEGKRQKYLKPFRLYLWCSIIYFLVLALASSQEIKEEDYFRPRQQGDITLGKASMNTFQTDEAAEALRSMGVTAYLDSLGIESAFERQVARQMIRVSYGPVSMNEYLWKNYSFMMILMVPVFAGVAKLFFNFKRKRKFLEYVVFSLHLHSFAFVFISVCVFLAIWTEALLPVTILLLGGIVVYLLVAVHRFSEQKWVPTVVLSTLALGLYSFILLVGIVITLFASLLLI